jgi:hypothetical protein
MSRGAKCFRCGNPLDDDERFVLARGKRREEHCSEACVRETVRLRRLATIALRMKWILGSAVAVLVLVGATALWQRVRVPHPKSISFDPPEFRPVLAGPVEYGPAWPPTDDDWMTAFRSVSWVYPLPGPVRRPPAPDGRIFGAEPFKHHPPICRREGHCGVDLGGELWGEHVYAALDGVVDRVQRSGGDDNGGNYVRLSHFGGFVYTQYFHLAAIPRQVVRGKHVDAGDLIGLLGDTGTYGGRKHLYFAMSIRLSSEFAEVFWDPTPLMIAWPLRVPAHGSVAGFVPEREDESSAHSPAFANRHRAHTHH